ncbi:Glyco_hydro_9 domain-containing protein [Cucumis melo var. makuwa]|uniref:cellulase n=1 Tax=Cucumis melo var. makuwa TaxID=1194695 RepID=A0A5D3DKF6_CUCMM|nr:Glyco_hydro_9 domain-containing protein [Cucumis melo var. makuwa]
MKISNKAIASIISFLSILPLTHSFNYHQALSISLLYFESQRSGRLPYNQRLTWRHHSGLADGLHQGVDLVGGYYDAGDNVKFGLPMAFTVTMLSWGVIEYGEQIAAAGEYTHALEAIKWGTDYFIKAHPHPNVLWAQVGDGATDHYCWQRPEDMTTSRQAYKIDENNPGSDVAGETAAAMAAAAILFEFGDKYRGKYDESIEVVKGYYPSASGYMDELLWAAMWLHKASGKEEYLKYLVVEEKQKEEKLIVEAYKSKAEHYLCSCLNKSSTNNNLKRTPGGLLYTRKWNNLQYVATATFLLTLYSDHLQSSNQRLRCSNDDEVGAEEMLSLAKSQVDYIVGDNPMGMSYLVGFGPRYPERVHHRGASMESVKEKRGFIGCVQGYDDWYGRVDRNPNVLMGAVVGGPNERDEFNDERSNFMQTEACTYNTAPLVGVFARFNQLQSQNYDF